MTESQNDKSISTYYGLTDLNDRMEDSDTERDPFHVSDDSDKDPNYIPKEKSKNNIPDYFKLHKRSNRTPHQNTQDSQASTSSTLSTTSVSTDHGMRNDSEESGTCTLFDGTFYKITEEGPNCFLTAQCQCCIPKMKLIKGRSNCTTNFLKHLKVIHPGEYQKYLKQKSSKRKPTMKNVENINILSNNPDSPDTTHNYKHGAKRQLNILSSFSINKKVSQEEFDDRITKFVSNTMSALSIIENNSFVQLFSGFGVKVMSRTTLVRRVDNLTKNKLSQIKKSLSLIEFVCTTADIWSAKKRSFLGITCHWIDPKTYSRQSAALACTRFSGAHTYEKIAELLDEIHTKFGLKQNKITATVTDNGSNFVKAFKEFGIQIDDSLIINQIAAGDEVVIEDIDISEPTETSHGEDSELLEETIFTPFNENYEETGTEELIKIHLPNHHRCVSHTINLIATTDFLKFINSSHTNRNRHTNIMNKCTHLWNKAGRPKSAEIIKNILGHHLSYPGITRWNSHYDSIKQILEEKVKLNMLYEELSIKNFCLKENEVEYLEEYVKLLKPLALALDMLQGQTNVYFGFVLPTIASLKVKLEKLKGEKLKYLAPAVDELLSAVINRFKKYLTLNDENTIIAAVSHPTFKLRWITTLKDPASGAIEENTQKIKNIFISAANREASVNDSTHYENDVSVVEKDSLMNFFEFDEFNYLTEQTVTCGQGELQALQYLQDPETTLTMLQKYPAIERLFIKYNTTLPSSAPVERMFSYATFINTPRRHALSDTNFENLVLLKANGV